jgi:hypothetical protein
MPPAPPFSATPAAAPTLEQEMRQSALLFGMFGLVVVLLAVGIGALACAVALARALA